MKGEVTKEFWKYLETKIETTVPKHGMYQKQYWGKFIGANIYFDKEENH